MRNVAALIFSFSLLAAPAWAGPPSDSKPAPTPSEPKPTPSEPKPTPSERKPSPNNEAPPETKVKPKAGKGKPGDTCNTNEDCDQTTRPQRCGDKSKCVAQPVHPVT